MSELVLREGSRFLFLKFFSSAARVRDRLFEFHSTLLSYRARRTLSGRVVPPGTGWGVRGIAGPELGQEVICPRVVEYLRKEASIGFFFFFFRSNARLTDAAKRIRRREAAVRGRGGRRHELNQFWMSTVSATTFTLAVVASGNRFQF